MATPADVLQDSDGRRAGGGAPGRVEITLRIRRFNPEVSQDSWWDEFTVQRRPARAARRGAAPGEVVPRRHAELPAVVRPRHLRQRRDADQRPQRARVQGARRRRRARRSRSSRSAGFPVLKDLIVDMDPFLDGYKAVLPFLINDSGEPEQRAPAVGRGTRPVRRHDQVHPVRGVHHVVSDLLGRRGLHRPGRDRERAPVHLRLARRGRARAPEDPEREDRRVPVPHDVQLHGSVPARHPGHEGDPGSEALDPVRPLLSGSAQRPSPGHPSPRGTIRPWLHPSSTMRARYRNSPTRFGVRLDARRADAGLES